MIEDGFDRFAKRRLLPVDDEIPFSEALGPYRRTRLTLYKEEKDKAVADARILEGDSMACDLDRGFLRPGVSYGQMSFRTLVSHGTIWHDKFNRCLVPEEWVAAHCVPTAGMPVAMCLFALTT